MQVPGQKGTGPTPRGGSVFCPEEASVLREGQSQGSLEGSFFVNAVVLGTGRDTWEEQMGPQGADRLPGPPTHTPTVNR